MTKILLITGTQNRHLSVAHQLVSTYNCDWITYNRKLVPQQDLDNLDKNHSSFLSTHLANLTQDEVSAIGKFSEQELVSSVYIQPDSLYKATSREDLNSPEAQDFVSRSNYDLAVVYGSGIISNDLLKAINCRVVNIHGGISPYFKGSSTFLYALLLCQPELIGFTIHDIDSGIDSGNIYGHIFPDILLPSMTPTEVFAAAQKALFTKIDSVVERVLKNELKPFPQSPYGRVFMERDFRIEMLYQIYEYCSSGRFSSAIMHLEGNRNKYKLNTLS